MKPRDFVARLEDARIVAAIREAEACTSGEIAVFISERHVTDAVQRATERFHKLGLERTRERNAVLIYFAPRSQQFAVMGDSGIHAKCGQPFWEEVTAEIGGRLRSEQFTEAVVGAVKKIGSLLAAHFPRGGDDRNELSDEIHRD